VIDCLIKNFGNHGIDFEPSTGGKLFVTDSNIVNNGTGSLDAGILVSPDPSAGKRPAGALGPQKLKQIGIA